MVNAVRDELTDVFVMSLIELKFLLLHFNHDHFHAFFPLKSLHVTDHGTETSIKSNPCP
jgi:hypothetical protein